MQLLVVDDEARIRELIKKSCFRRSGGTISLGMTAPWTPTSSSCAAS